MEHRRRDRVSLREHVLEALPDRIRDQLVEILTMLFSNGHSRINCGGNTAREKMWLDLLDESKISRIAGRASGAFRNTIDRALSCHVHCYLASHKEHCFSAWNSEQRPATESGAEGQQCFAKELAVKLQTDALSVRLDNFPKAAVLDLLTDVVELEANRLGLKAHGVAVQQHLVEFVCGFVWKLSSDPLEFDAVGRQHSDGESCSATTR